MCLLGIVAFLPIGIFLVGCAHVFEHVEQFVLGKAIDCVLATDDVAKLL